MFTNESFNAFVKYLGALHIDKFGSLSTYDEGSLWCALFHQNGDKYDMRHIGKFETQVRYEHGDDMDMKEMIDGIRTIVLFRFHPKYIGRVLELWNGMFED